MKEITIKHNDKMKVFKVSPKLFEELTLNLNSKTEIGDKILELAKSVPDEVFLHSIVWDY